MVYYNEIDPYAAQWLRNLISAGHIAKGDVDERSIKDVKPDDLRGYAQCHFFAGIGVWSYALRLAGWPDDRPVWTGSCPCQPFSAAGKGAGVNDERHLWPVWFNLIRECRPDTVFGEQVEAAVRHGWLDLVQSDLEGEGYALAPVGIPAAGVGAPHIRQRLWFVADAMHAGRPERRSVAGRGQASWDGCNGLLAHSDDPRSQGHWQPGKQHDAEGRQEPAGLRGAGGDVGGVADAESNGRESESNQSATSIQSPSTCEAASEFGLGERGAGLCCGGHSRTCPPHSPWRTADWLFCRDGKCRPVEPGTFPLAHGATGRVGRLRAYGNAIVPQVAAEVIGAYLDS